MLIFSYYQLVISFCLRVPFVYQFWLSSLGSVDRDTLTVPARRNVPTSGHGYACTCILSVLLVNITALLNASWSIRLIIMGRREQRERERKRAAASCCSLDNFLPGPSKKKTCTAAITSPVIEPEPAIPLANVAATNNEDTTNNEVEDCDEVTPSGSKSTEVSNEPLSGMKDERQITSERVPVGELHNDIGTVFQRAKSSNAFAVAIQALSTADNFSLLKCDKTLPLHDYVFPVTSFGQYNRTFQPKLFLQYTWMMYSKSVDGVFCKFCALLHVLCIILHILSFVTLYY